MFRRNHRHVRTSLLLLSRNTLQRRSVVSDTQNLLWEGVVGLKIHAKIRSDSKLFSGAGTKFEKRLNYDASLFDSATPGTLPVLNRECVKKAVMIALALNCTIHETSWFDRKHYSWSYLPAGYLITQQKAPFATDGCLEYQYYTNIALDEPCLRKSKVKRIQLEQDVGQSMREHDTNLLIDLNRAGNPLLEIIFEPDLRNGDEAACLVKELILILRKLDSCPCSTEEDALRVDANISVRPKGLKELGGRAEVKNMGGAADISKAVNYEIERQVKFCRAGRQITSETRVWDAVINRTVAVRDTEIVEDYRFMPEPNLPPLRLSLNENCSLQLINVPALKKELPELPAAYRTRLLNHYQLPVVSVIQLLVQPKLMDYFIEMTNENPKRNVTSVGNFILKNLMDALNAANMKPEQCAANSKALGEVYDLHRDQAINRVIMARLLDVIVQTDEESPNEIVGKNQLYQVDDKEIIEESCRLTIEFNPEWTEEYHRSKNLLRRNNFKKLYIEALEHTLGRANLILLKKTLEKLLNNGNRTDNEK